MQPEYFLIPLVHSIVTTKFVTRVCVRVIVVHQIYPELDICARFLQLLSNKHKLVDNLLDRFQICFVIQP